MPEHVDRCGKEVSATGASCARGEAAAAQLCSHCLQMQLTVRTGRVEKATGAGLRQALAKGHSSKAPAAEVIDLDESSREGSPEAASRAGSPPAPPASGVLQDATNITL